MTIRATVLKSDIKYYYIVILNNTILVFQKIDIFSTLILQA